MLAIDPRVLRGAWTVFLFVLTLVVIYEIGHALIIFALALFLALLLSSIVDRVRRFTPQRISRPVALGVVYCLMLGVIAAITIPIGSSIAEEAAILATKVPDALKQDPLGGIPLPGSLEQFRPRVTEFLRNRLEELNDNVLPVLSRASGRILTGIGSILSLVLIPILAFFFLKDGPAMRDAIIDAFDIDHQTVVAGILNDLYLLLVQYIRALVLLSMASFVATLSFLTVLGVQYAVLLAGVAAILEFIPIAGPLTSAAVILLVSAFTGFAHVWWVALFLLLYRLFQDYVLNPFLMSAGVEVHPLLVLFGVIAGEQLAGIPGMFFSVPVIAALRVVFQRLRRKPL